MQSDKYTFGFNLKDKKMSRFLHTYENMRSYLFYLD